VAATYGWTARRVETELTDEQFITYLDEAFDRTRSTFESDVEVARLGVIFAHNNKAYGKWTRRANASSKPRGLHGESLERAIAALRMTNPEYVVEGPRA